MHEGLPLSPAMQALLRAAIWRPVEARWQLTSSLQSHRWGTVRALQRRGLAEQAKGYEAVLLTRAGEDARATLMENR